MRTFILFAASLSLAISLPKPLWAGLILRVGNVTLDSSILPQIVEVPVFAIHDEPILTGGFNLNFDIGNNGRAPLPTGFQFANPVAAGGETAAGWALQMFTNPNQDVLVSDVLVAGQVDTGSPIQLNGNTATLSGGALLFNLRFAIDPNVSPGTTPIRIPNDGPLPAIFEFKQGAQFPPIPITGLIDGSITITSVPDPSSMSLVAIATITMLSAFWFRQFYSHTISTG